jgi:hypothetical protein
MLLTSIGDVRALFTLRIHALAGPVVYVSKLRLFSPAHIQRRLVYFLLLLRLPR